MSKKLKVVVVGGLVAWPYGIVRGA